jgi:ABC-type amino acid transport substrate-binding protein
MRFRAAVALCAAIVWAIPAAASAADAAAGDLEAVKRRGVLRHLGIPYANFVTGGGDGFDLELAQLFARRLGVRYEFVETDWPRVLPDLTGRKVSAAAPDPRLAAAAPVRGDLVATGLTILPWRQRAATFSTPLFPTQVWVVARADSKVRPIAGSGDVQRDIAERAAFEELLVEAKRDGTYQRLVDRYFPEVAVYFPDFFAPAPRG